MDQITPFVARLWKIFVVMQNAKYSKLTAAGTLNTNTGYIKKCKQFLNTSE